ncbi:hypothetical protein ACI797_01580 [Geodermatophilus sp. SYSU D00691]
MTSRLVRATVVGGVGLALAAAVPTSAQAAALVFLFRDQVDCVAGPNDAPFLPAGVGITNSTVVVTPDGGLNVTCFGQLPEGVPAPTKTYAGSATCHSDTGVVGRERVVVTTNGRITITCHIPPA